MVKIIIMGILVSSLLFSEDLSNLISNTNYQEVKVKIKAKSKSNSRECYIYIDINGNEDWEEKKEELNIEIGNKKSKCKKIIIYKSIQNVNTGSNWKLSGRYSQNSQNKDYDLNLGVIIKENSDINIEMVTVVKNSKIGSGLSKQEANIGIIVENDDEDIDIDNQKLSTSAIIKNSNIGKENSIIQEAIDTGIDFIKNDKDDPFNND